MDLGTTSAEILTFPPSQEAQERVRHLLTRNKTGELTEAPMCSRTPQRMKMSPPTDEKCQSMLTPSPEEITQLLISWSHGDQAALSKLMPLVYDELHRLAHRYMRRERPGHTLQTTALVNEVYLRLVDQTKVQWQNRAHFFGIAANLMRQILVNYALRHRAAKRGGSAYRLTFDEAVAVSKEPDVDLIALDQALTRLAALDPRQARIVELRFFGGLTIEETAEVLNLSPATVKREWNTAKAWLHHQLQNADYGMRIGGKET